MAAKNNYGQLEKFLYFIQFRRGVPIPIIPPRQFKKGFSAGRRFVREIEQTSLFTWRHYA